MPHLKNGISCATSQAVASMVLVSRKFLPLALQPRREGRTVSLHCHVLSLQLYRDSPYRREWVEAS
jgi:hypothetical protein